VFDYSWFGLSAGTLVPMGSSMARRLAVFAATVAAAAAVAAPATQARTVYTLTGHGWGHGIGLSQYGALGYAQHGWAYDAILAHYYTGTTLKTLSSSVQMRIQLSSGHSSYAISGASKITVVDEGGTKSKTIPSGSYRVERGTRGLRVVDAATNARVVKHLTGPVRLGASRALRVDSTVGIGWAHDHWHGYLRVIRSGGSLMLVDVVPLEYYLRGVVPSEMPSSWLPAALRAQAVAARSYADATRHPTSSFDAYADTRSQVYGPIEHEAAASNAAVAATAHKVLWYNGAVAVGFFSSSSGGWTASEQAAWGSGGEPYLVPVRDRYDGAQGLNPNHTWKTRVLTPRGLARALGVNGKVRSVDLTIDGPSQRVTHAVFHTGLKNHSYSGPGAQVALGLRSNYFRIVGVSLKGPARTVAGTRFNLTGRVWPKPHHRISLLVHDGPGQPWTTAADKLSLANDGTFSLSVHPKQNRVYRLGLPGGAVSPRQTIAVAPSLQLARSGPTAFRATIFPVLPGAKLTLQRNRSAGWKAVADATVGTKGHARFAVAGTVGRWRVSFHGDATHAASRSPVLTSPHIWRG
jgi:stage II sporulation protein D